jgi:iron complex outermembrane receptor protein
MFKLIAFAILLLSSILVQAQDYNYTFSGSVRDGQTYEALVGATVQLEPGSRGAVTDEAGRFALTNINQGEYTISVRFLGYDDKIDTLSINANLSHNILLAPGTQLTDEVVVYATRANNKTPTTFTNIGRQSLQKQNFGQDMPFLLNWTPSLVTTSDAGTGVGYTGLRIRGSDATRINVTINGIPYNDSESQGTFWVNIPDIVSSTESVQVQRGVGTSTNGAGSFGGSVNLQTLSLQANPYAEATAAAGSFNTQRYSLKAGTGLIHNRWAFDGRLSRIVSDGYIDRASSDLNSFYLSAAFHTKNTIVKAITFGGHEVTYQSWNGVDAETLKINRTFNSAGALYDADGNVTGYYDNEVDDYRQNHYQLHVAHRFNNYWNANVAGHYTYGRGFFEQYKQGLAFADLGLNDISFKDTTLTSSDVIVRKWLDNHFYGGTFSLNYDKHKTTLTMGGAYNQYADAKHFGEIIWAQYSSNADIRHRYYQGDAQKNDFNIYAKWNYELTTAFSVFVDLQYRTINYETQGIDDNLQDYNVSDEFHFFNPKAGLSYTLGKGNLLYASYAIANREPNRVDYLSGGAKPKREQLGNLEAGWRKSATRYSLEVNYYLMNYRDQLVLTGQLDNVGNPIRANVGKSFRTGVEVTGGVQLNSRWSWQGNITRSVSRNINFVVNPTTNEVKNTTIILSPDWVAGSQLAWSPFQYFQITLLSKFVGKQYLDNTQNETLALDGYVVNDLRLAYTWKPRFISEINFGLLLNNILDETYSSNGYSFDGVAYFYPQAGRLAMASVTLKF